MRIETETASGGAVSPDVAAKSKPKGIAVLGSHPKTVRQAPFDDDWLIYACSPDNTPHGHSAHRSQLPRLDLWFEVHVPVFDRSRPYEYLEWLKNTPNVYMRDRYAFGLRTEAGKPLFPTAILYPEDEMKGIFGPFTFTSSIAFILAKAIVDCEQRGIPTIGLWGIMQSSENEYAYQRPGIQNLIWEACRRGINVTARALFY